MNMLCMLLAALMGAKRILIQANHGPIVAAEDVPTAWWYLYYLERVAKLTIAAMSTGRPLRTIADKVWLNLRVDENDLVQCGACCVASTAVEGVCTIWVPHFRIEGTPDIDSEYM